MLKPVLGSYSIPFLLSADPDEEHSAPLAP